MDDEHEDVPAAVTDMVDAIAEKMVASVDEFTEEIVASTTGVPLEGGAAAVIAAVERLAGVDVTIARLDELERKVRLWSEDGQTVVERVEALETDVGELVGQIKAAGGVLDRLTEYETKLQELGAEQRQEHRRMYNLGGYVDKFRERLDRVDADIEKNRKSIADFIENAPTFIENAPTDKEPS